MKCMAASASYVVLRGDDEFWDHTRTIRELHKGKYFDGDGSSESASDDTDRTRRWPPILRAVVEGGRDGALALSALGATIWHTRRALIDHDLLSMRRFAAYIPSDMHPEPRGEAAVVDPSTRSPPHQEESAELPSASSLPGSGADAKVGSHMVLDGVSLSNLEVLRNSCDGGEKGSLWGFINRCSTAFGRRLLKDWLLKPLVTPRCMLRRPERICTVDGHLIVAPELWTHDSIE